MNIVIEIMHGMGDVVCMLPLIKEVRNKYIDANITVLVNKKITVDILKCSDIRIERIIPINAHDNLVGFIKTCLKLRKEKIDISISAGNTPVKKAKLMMALVGAKEKVGLQFSKGICGSDLEDKYHFVDTQLLALEQMGIENHHYQPSLIPNIDEVKKFQEEIVQEGAIVGICIGRGDITYKDPKKRKNPVYTRGWGNLDEHVSNVLDLIKRVSDSQHVVLLIGGKQEKEIIDRILPKLSNRPNIYNFVGKTSVSESISLASICDVVVGVDTGMQHIADALGVKTVSLFGPTNPKTHGAYSSNAIFAQVQEKCRYCYGTNLYVECPTRKCMNRITPSMVFELIERSLERKNQNGY